VCVYVCIVVFFLAVVNAQVLYNVSVDPSQQLDGYEFRKTLAPELIGGRSFRKAPETGGWPETARQHGSKGHYPVYIGATEKRGSCSFSCKSDRERLHHCSVKCERCDMFFVSILTEIVSLNMSKDLKRMNMLY